MAIMPAPTHTRAATTPYRMPMHPTLIVTSELKPQPWQQRMDNVAAHARTIPAAALGQVIHRSPGTVTRRRRGRGWNFLEVVLLMNALGIGPGELLQPPRPAGEVSE